MSERVQEPSVTIVVPVVVSVQRLRDLLCSAVEGGSTYWAHFSRCKRTADLDYLEVEVEELEAHSAKPRVQQRVSAEDLAVGLERLGVCAQTGRMPEGTNFGAAGQHLANFLSENDDAETADVVLQMTVFGTLIYG